MKLRNKKTGEIKEYDVEVIYYRKLTSYGYDDWTPFHPDDWEDYKPAEPLIKDKKIRKAVRAWAEALNIKECKHDAYWQAFRLGDQTISFFGLCDFDLKDENTYTIAELCGEGK